MEAGSPNPKSPNTDTPKMRGPVWWDIRGKQNNWNWKVCKNPGTDDEPAPLEEIDDEEIEYQTRFPKKHTAMLYSGAHASAALLATIKTADFSWSADITIPQSTGDRTITMSNTSAGGFQNIWPIMVETLNGRELCWEHTHPVEGDNDLYLLDPATKEVMAHGNDDFLSLDKELPEEVVAELVITGTAAQIMLSWLGNNHLGIAAQGPEGSDQWKYQDPSAGEFDHDEGLGI
jgi:hypothetical protein